VTARRERQRRVLSVGAATLGSSGGGALVPASPFTRQAAAADLLVMGRDLTTRQAAALLGVSPATLRTLADEGSLPHRRRQRMAPADRSGS
jgi:hypothetical protein